MTTTKPPGRASKPAGNAAARVMRGESPKPAGGAPNRLEWAKALRAVAEELRGQRVFRLNKMVALKSSAVQTILHAIAARIERSPNEQV